MSFLYPTKIISGGQTGVDRAALDWAIASHLAHGGWCPFGRLAQDGKVPEHYHLKETPSSGYSQRTRRNIEEAEATLIIHQGLLAGGSKLTLRFAQELNKPHCLFDLDKPWSPQADQAHQWCTSNSVHTLNIAGPSETRHPSIYDLTRKVLPLIFPQHDRMAINLPPELLQAFAETNYMVHNEAPFTMHIGQSCPELKALMVEHNAMSATFITAWNPFSQKLQANDNKARQDELKDNLKKRGLICIDGIGKHPSNNWPGEVSVLVLGLDLEAAKSLARHYEQHAFVWAAGDGVPELVQP